MVRLEKKMEAGPALKRSLRKVEVATRAEVQVGGEHRHETEVSTGNYIRCWTPRTVTRIYPELRNKDTFLGAES